MSRDWESQFINWGAAPGPGERTKAENAERAIRKAIDASVKLNARPIKVFTQGSYANRTNVREDSDVDVCVLYTGAFFPDYSLSEGLNDDILQHSTADYSYSDFKNDVETALVSYFDGDQIVRGQKAFDVHANSYRVDADVVPCFEHQRFLGTPENNWHECGTELHPDDGGVIINWPQQNYDNGVAKNTESRRTFKAVVRTLKRLRNEMADEGYPEAEPIPSFLIECLVWNVPSEEGFSHSTFTADVRYAVAYLWEQTRTDATCKDWGEINDRKYLFRGQAWSREKVNAFLYAAWNYVGFK